MAITVAHMANAVQASPGTPYSLSTSVAYADNRFYVVTFLHRGGASPDTTGLTGGGITWAKTVTSTLSVPPMSQWAGLTTSGASTAQLSVTISGGPSTLKWSIEEFAGVDTAAPLVQATAFTGGTNADGSITVPAFADSVNNAELSAWGETEADTWTVQSGWTGLNADNSGATASSMFTAYRIGHETPATANFNDATNAWRGTVLEVRAATAVTTRKLRVVTSPQRW